MSRRSTRITTSLADGGGMPTVQAHIMPSISSASVPSSGLYLQSHYNHPANNRLYLGPNSLHSGYKGHHGSIGSAVPKAPKPPEKPLMPYMRYSRKVWDEVKANNPDAKLWEIGKIIGQMWRELPTSDKQQYIEEYEVEKVEHLDLMKSYHNSPSYQSYLHAKNRAEAMEAAESLGAEKDDAYMSIEPIDDHADDDAEFSVKHVAAARFQRNHRLINDILGESVHVPNMRAVVTTHRLNVLKNQVQSLQLHQKKLEAELKHIEEMQETKKRRWKGQAKGFQEDMKRLCSMSPQEYYKEHKLKQQQQAELIQQQKLQQAAASAEAAKAAFKNSHTPQAEASSEKAGKGETPSTNSMQNPADLDTEEGKAASTVPKEEDVTEKMDVEDATSAQVADDDVHEKDDQEESAVTEEGAEQNHVDENINEVQDNDKAGEVVSDVKAEGGSETGSSDKNVEQETESQT